MRRNVEILDNRKTRVEKLAWHLNFYFPMSKFLHGINKKEVKTVDRRFFLSYIRSCNMIIKNKKRKIDEENDVK